MFKIVIKSTTTINKVLVHFRTPYALFRLVPFIYLRDIKAKVVLPALALSYVGNYINNEKPSYCKHCKPAKYV